MFLYILSLYLLTYREGLNLVSNGLALGLVFTITINFLIFKKSIIFNKLLFIYLVFLLISIISVYYAIDQSASLTKVKTLILLFVLMFSIINYIDTFKKLRDVMNYIVYSGAIASSYIILNSDFTQFSRLGSDLGNVNTIGTIIGISVLLCFYFLLEEKRYIYILFIIIMAVVILLTGSRGALLFTLVNILAFLFFINRNGVYKRLKFIILSVLLLLIVYYLTFNVPFLYQTLGIRLESMFTILGGGSSNEGSIYTRSTMIEAGIEMFKDRPFTGYGIGNYGTVYSSDFGGRNTYAHNNLIELIVGTGIFGMIFFYLTHLLIIKDLLKIIRDSRFRVVTFIFISLNISYMISSISSVYYYSKQFTIILAIGSVISLIYKRERES
jgi:O-antigen ligase